MSDAKDYLIFQLQQKRLQNKNKKIKLKNNKISWLIPIIYEKEYLKEIRKIINQYILLTVNKIKPLLKRWNEENKFLQKDSLINDNPDDELEEFDNDFDELDNQIYVKESHILRNILIGLALKVGIFNNKQFNKNLNNKLGITINLRESWEEPMIRAWVTRNVGLIKGLTNEYRKKIKDTILSGFANGETQQSIAKKLTAINNNMSKARSNLIARDQINTINAQYSQRRMRAVGIEVVIWNSSLDERVRPSHAVMEGKFCKLDDPTVYADTEDEVINNEWKNRSSIGGVELHAGMDINCRCTYLPEYIEILEEVNND